MTTGNLPQCSGHGGLGYHLQSSAISGQVGCPEHAVAELHKIRSLGQLLGLKEIDLGIASDAIPERKRLVLDTASSSLRLHWTSLHPPTLIRK